MKNIILGITAFVVMACSVGLYFWLFPGFYNVTTLVVSLIIVCLAELGIIGSVSFLPKLNAKSAVMTTYVNVYLFMLIAWCFGYPLYMMTSTGKFEGDVLFYIVLMAITIIFGGLIGFAGFGAIASDELNNKTEVAISEKRQAVRSVQTLFVPIEMTLQQRDDEESAALLKQVRVLTERISAMPTSQVSDPIIYNSFENIKDIVLQGGKEKYAEASIKVAELTRIIKNI